MTRYTMRALWAAFAVLLAIPLATPASAQATRTWVSGVGDDVNPCSRTAPCRTFAGSISKTAAGGEINCLDPASFGAVTITKSIKLLCDNVDATIIASGVNGILIAAGAADNVVISGINIDGINTGTNGVRIISAANVHLRNMTIRGFRGATSYGVSFVPTTATTSLVVDNVTLVKNGIGNGSGGILVQPANNVAAKVAINNVQASDIGGTAVRFDTTGFTGVTVKATLANSVFTDSASAILAKVPTGNVVDAVISKNVISGGQNGIVAQDVGASLYASGNLISQNSAFGVRSVSGGAMVSLGDNEVINNGNNGAFTATVGKQ